MASLAVIIAAVVFAVFASAGWAADQMPCDSKDKTPCGVGAYNPCGCQGKKHEMRKDGEPDNTENARNKRARCKTYCTPDCCGCKSD